MKNQNNTPSKGKKENQIVFIEYEKPTQDGHFITAVDSYHNVLGRIQRSYNPQSRKFDHTAFDHDGKPLFITSEKVWELKNQFIKNREQLLESAHQRRIDLKNQTKGQESPTKESESKILKGREKPSTENINGKEKNGINKPIAENDRTEKFELPAVSQSHYDREYEIEDAMYDSDAREEDLQSFRDSMSDRDKDSLDR
ncbi:hypothetical protein BH11BAC1_BH11BAC1_23060 [soil metagenome]